MKYHVWVYGLNAKCVWDVWYSSLEKALSDIKMLEKPDAFGTPDYVVHIQFDKEDF